MAQEKRSALALTLAGFFCLGIPISGNHWCFSVFVLPLEAEFGWTRSQINLGEAPADPTDPQRPFPPGAG